MGFLEMMRRPAALTEVSAIQLPIASPWREGELSQILFSDLVGADVAAAYPPSRSEALTVPAVAKGRALLVSQIARLPLVALDGAGPIATQPTWMQRTNTPVSPYVRMALTVDDCLFYGLALWRLYRGAKADQAAHAPILAAEHISRFSWEITSDSRVAVIEPDESRTVLDDDDYVLFEIPGFDGLLAQGHRTIVGARDTELAWTARIRNPVPLLELSIDEEGMDPEEAKALAKTWNEARRSPDGATAVTPSGTSLIEHGTAGDAQLYIENRNAIRADVAAHLGTRAAMLDGTTGQASLTYTTAVGEQSAFFGLDLPFWTDPIEAALSQDKVCPSGQRVRFDKSDQFTPAPTGTPTSD